MFTWYIVYPDVYHKEGARMATIVPKKDKAGNVRSYKFMVCVGRDEVGKQIWRTTTLRADDPQITETTPKKREKQIQSIADAWEQAQRKEFEQTNSKRDTSKITLAAFTREIWWAQHVMDGSHKPTSISFYKNLSDSILEYKPLADKQLQKITAADVKAYIVYLQTKATTKDGQPLSQTTVVRHYQTLRNILNFGIRFGYFSDDPCKALSVKDKPHKDAQSIDFLEPKEAQRFMKALAEEPLFWRTMLTTMISVGLRRGEVIGLQWGDIDVEKQTISVQRNITIDSTAPEKYAVGTPKSGHSRTVPLPSHVYSLFQQLKKEQEDRNGAKVLPTAYIFSRIENPYKPVYPTEPTRWQSKFVKRHGLKDVSCHDLRHSFAALSLESGANIKQIQTILGHKDVSTTLSFYAGISQEAERRAVEGVEALLTVNNA